MIIFYLDTNYLANQTKLGIHAKFELSRLLGSRARECDAARQTPGETRANPGTAWLVLGSELIIAQLPKGIF